MGWIPFSNGTEFMDWMGENCEQCVKCDPEDSTGDSTCSMEYELAKSIMTGKISLDSCEKIGWKALSEQKHDNFVRLKTICSERVL